MMTIQDLQDQLRVYIRARIGRGELTGSALARQASLPQGHLSNFLNSRRGLSLESMDRLMNALHLGVLDLLGSQFAHLRAPRRAGESVEPIAMVAAEHAGLARFASDQVLETRNFSRSFLQRLKPSHDHDRDDWQRFCAAQAGAGQNARQIVSLEMTSATLLVDRHYIALEPYRRRQPNLYAVRFGANCVAGYLSFVGSNLVLRTGDLRAELHDLHRAGPQLLARRDCRVCHVSMEI